MKIHEYQAKEILKGYGIKVPQGIVVDNFENALTASKELGFPLVIKAQAHVGGRGKAGAIKIVRDKQEFEKEFQKISGMDLKGIKVRKILLEKALNIKKQFYLGVTIDRSKQSNTIMASSEGGIEIEEVASVHPEKIIKISLNPANQLNDPEIKNLASLLKLPDSSKKSFEEIVVLFLKAYTEIDAFLAEINPLVLTDENEWIACDAKMIIDDNALYRHESVKALEEEAEDDAVEMEAHRRKIAYVKLPGNIGIIGNGAGLVMTTMDEVKRMGGNPANFLDIGGGAKEKEVQNALEIIEMDKKVEGIFINIFGGITRCDEVAKGIIQAAKNRSRKLPIVLRLSGTRAKEGRALLEKSDLISTETMEEGAKKIVEIVQGKNEHYCR